MVSENFTFSFSKEDQVGFKSVFNFHSFLSEENNSHLLDNKEKQRESLQKKLDDLSLQQLFYMLRINNIEEKEMIKTKIKTIEDLIRKGKEEVKQKIVNENGTNGLAIEYQNPSQAKWIDYIQKKDMFDIENINVFCLFGYATKLITKLDFGYQQKYKGFRIQKEKDNFESIVIKALNFGEKHNRKVYTEKNDGFHERLYTNIAFLQNLDKVFVFSCGEPEQMDWIKNVEQIEIGNAKKIRKNKSSVLCI